MNLVKKFITRNPCYQANVNKADSRYTTVRPVSNHHFIKKSDRQKCRSQNYSSDYIGGGGIKYETT